MPTVTLSKKVLEKITGKKLPLEQLKERISMLGTDLEGIEGDEIKVEIFPNRPDMLSEQGFGRAFGSFMGKNTGLHTCTIKKSGYKVIVDSSVHMRPYTACAIVKNITCTDERIRDIMQMQEKLATTHGRNRKKSAYGIYPLDNIHFPVKYTAKDPTKVLFHPLGFDNPIQANTVEELHPKGREYSFVAQGWKHYPFFIDSKEHVLCMLPYTNSHDTGKIGLDTKNVFIECTGTDLNNVTVALNIFVMMFADMGGDVYSLDIEYKKEKKIITTPNLTPQRMKLNVAYINKILGLSLSEKETIKFLERMGIGYEKGYALIPAYREDVLHQIDLAEDVAIAYGYENFEEVIPNVATIGESDTLERFIQTLQEICIGLGLIEIKTYHLDTLERLNTFMQKNDPIIPVLDAVGDHNVLRNTILSGLLRVLGENKHNEYPQNIFEIGRVFAEDKRAETGIHEEQRLGIALCHETTDFTEGRQVIDTVFSSLGIKYTVKESNHPSCIPGRVATIMLGKTKVGYVGEIHPHVLTCFGIDTPVTVCVLSIEQIQKKAHL